jgi:hypothetical protein
LSCSYLGQVKDRWPPARRRSPRPPPHKSRSVGPSDRRIPFLAPSGRCETGRVGDPREGPRFRRDRIAAAVAASMGRESRRLGSVEIPKPAGGESPFSGPVPRGRGCGSWRGDLPAGFHRLIEQSVSFLSTATERRVIVLTPRWVIQPSEVAQEVSVPFRCLNKVG